MQRFPSSSIFDTLYLYHNMSNPLPCQLTSQNGYRLPSSAEWEYTARYLGTTSPSEGDLAAERLFGDDTIEWTDRYYWTPGEYASGATADYTDETACRAVAVYDYADPDPYDDEQAVKSLEANTLGLYDMSGNVWELCFTKDGSFRSRRGGSWNFDNTYIRLGYLGQVGATTSSGEEGFRLCRSSTD